MTKRIDNQESLASSLLAAAKEKSGDFAYQLAAMSLQSHLDDLAQIKLSNTTDPAFEILDIRIMASHLKTGSAPLDLVASLSEKLRKIIGFAALKLETGGSGKKVTKQLYEDLDLRLHGLLPGSSRFVVSATSGRDMLGYSTSKESFDRVFSVLGSGGKGKEFLSSVDMLGPASAKNLRDLFKLLKSHSAQADFVWRYSGKEVVKWHGTNEGIKAITEALEATKITEQEGITLHGTIELLSKRERIELRTDDGYLIKVLYPKSQLEKVNKLHLEQRVNLSCLVTETKNPLTNESSVFYELKDISPA